MGEPACGKDEQRPLPGGRVRDAPAVELAEANALLHGPVNAMARSGHVKKMARRGSLGPCSAFTIHICTHASSTASRSDHFGTVTRARSPPSSRASGSAHASAASAARSHACPRWSSRISLAWTRITTSSSATSTAIPSRCYRAPRPQRPDSRDRLRRRGRISGKARRHDPCGRACRRRPGSRHRRARRDGVR